MQSHVDGTTADGRESFGQNLVYVWCRRAKLTVCLMRTQVVKIIMRKVLQAIDGLHSLGIVHRDIKPQNILITVAGICPERPHPEPGT